MAANATPMNQASPIPQPPRLTGEAETDIASLNFWANQLYQYGVLQGGLLTAETQSQSGTFSPTNLPNPGASTVATAQTVANEAYTLAETVNTAEQALNKKIVQAGSFMVTGASSSPGAITITTAQTDTNYFVVCSPSAIVGAPASGALLIDSVAKAAGSFTPSVSAQPGVGNSVTYDYLVMRNA